MEQSKLAYFTYFSSFVVACFSLVLAACTCLWETVNCHPDKHHTHPPHPPYVLSMWYIDWISSSIDHWLVVSRSLSTLSVRKWVLMLFHLPIYLITLPSPPLPRQGTVPISTFARWWTVSCQRHQWHTTPTATNSGRVWITNHSIPDTH